MSNSSFFTGSGITANQTSAIETSVTAAATSATSSASSATTSSAKAATATTKANEAAASAAASEASKDASVVAKNSAVSALASATTQATNSANSASSAGSQASSASSSASTASNHASTATTKANEAAASAAVANTKAGIATTAANSTSGSASAASSSASSANQAKIGALAAELEAENAEAAALNAASIATTKAQVASEAAITATNKANQVTTDNNTATTKANEAAASATSAAASATTSTASKNTAVAVTANFLGAHSSAPTQTASGGALAVGMLYFDTTSDVLKVRASGGFINAGSSINGTSARFAYTLTANQTTVTGNDLSGNSLQFDAPFCDVFLNGAKLAAADMNISSGTSVVLAAGATAGDILEVVAFGTFQLTNGTFAGTTTVNNLTVTGTVDGQDVAAMGTKLAGIENNATADQTKSDIEGLGIDVPATNLTGTIAAARLSTATTQAESDDSTKIATTAYVVDKITTLIGGAPSTLNDLSELAAAINNDANYNSTLTTALATKMPKAGGAFTGAVTTNSTFDGVDIATRDGVLTTTTNTANAALPKAGGTLTGTLTSTGLIANAPSNTGLTINSADVSAIQFNVANGGQKNWGFASTSLAAGDFGLYQSNSNGGNPITAGTPKLYLNSSGSVGIGVSDPDSTLDISGGSNKLGILRVTQRASGASAYGLDVGLDPSTGDPVFSRIVNDTVTEAFRVQRSSGNVGIRAAAPDAPFVVQSDSGGNTVKLLGRSSDNIAGLVFSNAANNASNYIQGNSSYIRARADGGFHFSKGSTPTVSDAGAFTVEGLNFGIGTASPGGNLQIGDHWTVNAIYGGSHLYIKDVSGAANGDPHITNTDALPVIISTTSTNANGPDKVGLVLHNDDTTAGTYSPMLLFTKRETTASPFKATMAGIWARSPTGNGSGTSWIDGELHLGTAGNGTNGVKSRMKIDSSGNALLGKTSATDSSVGIWLDAPNGRGFFTSSSNYCAQFRRLGSDGPVVYFMNDGAIAGLISVSGSSTTYATSSDYRLKENVDYTWDATTRLKQLKPARFNFIADADTTVDGFLAHEAATVVPEAVTGTKDAMRDEEYEVTAAVEEVTDDDGNVTTEAADAVMGTRSVPDMQGIDQSKLVPLLVKTIQELEARITALEAN